MIYFLFILSRFLHIWLACFYLFIARGYPCSQMQNNYLNLNQSHHLLLPELTNERALRRRMFSSVKIQAEGQSFSQRPRQNFQEITKMTLKILTNIVDALSLVIGRILKELRWIKFKSVRPKLSCWKAVLPKWSKRQWYTIFNMTTSMV